MNKKYNRIKHTINTFKYVCYKVLRHNFAYTDFMTDAKIMTPNQEWSTWSSGLIKAKIKHGFPSKSFLYSALCTPSRFTQLVFPFEMKVLYICTVAVHVLQI